MARKDLQRVIEELEHDPTATSDSVAMTRLVNDCPKSFYKWTDKNHWSQHSKQNRKQCCFWDWISPPLKDDISMPVLPYQRLLYRMLKERKHIWIKKSRGLGVTTFFLYWIAHQCLTQYKPGDRVCIVVGPRIDLAEDWIARFKSLFRENLSAIYSELVRQPSTIAVLNGVRVEAFPSHHVDTMRGLDRVKCIMSDETDYYPPFQQKEVRAVMEGYIGKPNSDPTIALISTPKEPGGLLQTIELEQNSLYYKLFFDYTYGLEGPQPIYSLEQIEQAKRSPDFAREFKGEYLGLIGNVFHTKDIDAAIEKDKLYNPNTVNTFSQKSVGLDPAWGSSAFGIVVTQWVDNHIQVLHAEEYIKPDFDEMVDITLALTSKYGISLRDGCQ